MQSTKREIERDRERKREKERERERMRENERKENCYFTFYYQHFHSALFILSHGLYAHNRLTRIDVKQENANKD